MWLIRASLIPEDQSAGSWLSPAAWPLN